MDFDPSSANDRLQLLTPNALIGNTRWMGAAAVLLTYISEKERDVARAVEAQGAWKGSNAQLAAKLAEAEKDRERLDWLEVQKGKLPGWMIETVSHDLGVMIQNCGAGYEKPETLREAIDTAREGE
jgi:hypothetical protein